MKKPKKEKADAQIMVRVSSDMKAMLEQLAAAENRSLSSLVVHMLKTGRAAK